MNKLTHEQFLLRLEGRLGFTEQGPISHERIWRSVGELQESDEPTVRDMLAAHALTGILHNSDQFSDGHGKTAAQLIAAEAYALADAMLEARRPKESA